jgi:hypothetical protein
MMVDQGTEAEFEVLDQAAGPEALVVWPHNLDDSDLVPFQEFLHGWLELSQVLTAQSARNADAGDAFRHVGEYLDHRFSFVVPPGMGSVSTFDLNEVGGFTRFAQCLEASTTMR